MSIYPCGTEVEIVQGKIRARINQVAIKFSGTSYELRWWTGTEFKSEWFGLDEFVTAATPQPIGFRK